MPSYRRSFSISRPATDAATWCETPSVDACARCALPNASFTKTVAPLSLTSCADRPFRLSVRELQAMLAVRKGDLKRARELWSEIAKDPQAPQAAAQRASAMLNFHGPAEAK
jgi:hypothetical protein